MPITKPKLPDTFYADVLDVYGTKLLTVYGESTRIVMDRATRAQLSLIGYAPSAIAELINSLSTKELKSVFALLNKEVLEDIYREEKTNG